MNKIKVVFISGMLPNGHYSQHICQGLAINPKIDLIVYTDKNPNNLLIENCGIIKTVWSKNWRFILEILRELMIDKPDIVHFQHEMNMYGSQLTAIVFPLLLLCTRLRGFKIVTTVHAAASRKQIDSRFVEMFGYDPKKIKPLFVKIFFTYIYFLVTRLSCLVIVHTELIKRILIRDYKASGVKIHVIPPAIPRQDGTTATRNRYFFYFGYMVRRKGLGFVLEGFKKFLDNHPESGFKLILAGGTIKGQELAYDEIKETIIKNNLEKSVELKGFIKQDLQDELYQRAYCTVIPAELSIAASGPLYHSDSYHRCALASKIGNFLEEIDDHKTGILVENSKWDEAFEYIVNNPVVVRDIEKNVKEKAMNRTPEKTALIYLDLYNRLVNKNA